MENSLITYSNTMLAVKTLWLIFLMIHLHWTKLESTTVQVMGCEQLAPSVHMESLPLPWWSSPREVFIEFFTNAPQYKNGNITKFVLAVLLEKNYINEVRNLE